MLNGYPINAANHYADNETRRECSGRHARPDYRLPTTDY